MSVYVRFLASPLDGLFDIFTKQDVWLHMEWKKGPQKIFFRHYLQKKASQ